MKHDVQMVVSTYSPELIDSELVLPVRSWCCTQKMARWQANLCQKRGHGSVGIVSPVKRSTTARAVPGWIRQEDLHSRLAQFLLRRMRS